MFAMALLEAVHLLFDPANGIKTEKCHFIHILDALESTFVFNVSLTFFFSSVLQCECTFLLCEWLVSCYENNRKQQRTTTKMQAKEATKDKRETTVCAIFFLVRKSVLFGLAYEIGGVIISWISFRQTTIFSICFYMPCTFFVDFTQTRFLLTLQSAEQCAFGVRNRLYLVAHGNKLHSTYIRTANANLFE